MLVDSSVSMVPHLLAARRMRTISEGDKHRGVLSPYNDDTTSTDWQDQLLGLSMSQVIESRMVSPPRLLCSCVVAPLHESGELPTNTHSHDGFLLASSSTMSTDAGRHENVRIHGPNCLDEGQSPGASSPWAPSVLI
jgi:hypothetical protein